MGSVVQKIEDTIGKAVSDVLGFVGGNIIDDMLGLDSLGQEVSRWGEDIHQTMNVLSGKYHSDQKKIQEYREQVQAKGNVLEARANKYNSDVDKLVDKIESLVAFHEIFQLAMGNRLDRLHIEYSAEMDQLNSEYSRMVAELKRMVAQIESDYDFVIGLTEGAFIQKIIGSVIMIMGGIMSDLGDIIEGKADGDSWKRIIMTIVLVILIIIAIFFPPAWGLVAGTATFTTTYLIIIGLMILNAFMTLDGMYANGAATGAIMGVLDSIFNDILNLDDLIGSDFEKFDRNHEDYSQMVGYVQLAISLTTVYLAWSSSSAYYAAQEASKEVGKTALTETSKASIGELGLQASAPGFMDTAMFSQSNQVVSNQSSYLGGNLIVGSGTSDSYLFGVTFTTYGKIYEAFNNALSIKDMVSANKQYNDLKEKLEEDRNRLNEAIQAKTQKSFMKHYKDTAYFLQDQQEYIDRYIWSMTAQNMYVDPYGTTPVANIRFTPDNDTRMLSFGFEDVFDESKLAGNRSYFNNILYG